MSVDFERIKKYLNDVKQVEMDLIKYQELFDPKKLTEFRHVTTALEQNMEVAKNDSRKLNIGIVGAVKAGKSSFLNACIFDGEKYLPEAAMPVTAALTRITYSDTPKAVIHFFTKEDWETIVRQSETQREAKELTGMVSDPTLLDKLGGTDEIDGDIIIKLNDYVGENGCYSPIVSYVELQVDNPNVKNFEIIDTPGLNDPIVSRSIRTKQFLHSCDVVLLLSPCSQFMNAETVNFMADSLPDTGIREIIVVGSKLDSGILNESTDDFSAAYKNALTSYKSQFVKSLSQVRNAGKHMDILDKPGLENVIFTSSMCFVIEKKLKNGILLDENEQKVYDNLHTVFGNFEDKYLGSLGGIDKVQIALNDVLKRKMEIIEDKNSGLLDNAKTNHLRILEKILQETVLSRTKHETAAAEELKQRSSNIRNIMDASREKLMYIFDGAIIKCDEKVQRILPELIVEMGKHQKIKVEHSTQNNYITEKVGLFGWKKEIVQFTVTKYLADTSTVINNIEQYAAKCHSYVNGEFQNIFNKEEFSQKIKEVILNAFNLIQKEFDEDDVLIPLKNVLAKISIPHIEFDFTRYIDEVETRFKNGYAENEEIHQLSSLQSRLLDQIENDVAAQLAKALSEITQTLKTQAVCFADQIEDEFCNELAKLQGQVEEKERCIGEYNKFSECIRKTKISMSSERY